MYIFALILRWDFFSVFEVVVFLALYQFDVHSNKIYAVIVLYRFVSPSSSVLGRRSTSWILIFKDSWYFICMFLCID